MTAPELHWEENSVPHSARWRSETGATPPKRVVVVDDTLTADMAYRQACEGVGLLWRGVVNALVGVLLFEVLERRVVRRTVA